MIKRFGFQFIILLFIITPAFADQAGSSDSYGYMWTNSTTPLPTIDFDWIDISGEPSIFGSSFDDSLSTAIPLPFSFYGNNQSQVYISSHGWFSFGNAGGLTYPNNTSIPGGAGPDSMIAVYWDSLSSTVGNNGGVYHRTIGTSPNRKFIIQWHILNGSPADEINFQVILYEHSNLIKFQYNTIDAAYSGGASATIGIKNHSTQGNEYSFNSPSSVSAGDAILFHNSYVTGVNASILPTSVQIDTNVSFTYTIDNITGPGGLGKLDHFAIANPFTNTPIVTGVTINGTAAYYLQSSSKPPEHGYATWEYVAYSGPDSIIVRTSHFDVINSIVITFLENIPTSTSPGSYDFGSSSDAKLDLSDPYIPSPSPSITVTGGNLDDIIIRDAPGGFGNEVTTHTMDAGDDFTVYAAGYDAGDNFIGDQATAVWSVIGNLDPVGGPGSSITFSPTTAPTTGSIVATVGTTINDATGTITVNPGGLDSLVIRDAPNNGGSAVNVLNLTTDDVFTFYSAGYDAEGNYRGDELVIWTSTFGLSGSGTSSITFAPDTTVTAGVLIATSGSVSDQAGPITVITGALAYLKIRNAPFNGGGEVGPWTMQAGDNLVLYAAGYDADNNYKGDQTTAIWSVTGNLDPVGGPNSSITFSPTTAPTTGSIVATVGTTINDATGTITVNPGGLDSLVIRDAPNNGGSAVNVLNLTTDDVFTFYSAGYDAEGNYRGDELVIWTSTFGLSGSGTSSITFAPDTTVTAGVLIATSGSVSDQAGPITVITGALAYLKIRNAPFNGGGEVGPWTMQAGDNLVLYAAGYDADNNYKGDQTTAIWSLTGNLDPPGGVGDSFTFSPTSAPTGGSINATISNISDATGNIIVNVGALDHVRINGSAGSDGQEFGSTTLTAGQSLTLFANGYDAYNNYRSEKNVNWSTTPTLDPTTGFGPSFTFIPSTASTSGFIVADSGSYIDSTGLITIALGSLHHIIIRDSTNGGGNAVGNRTISSDDSLDLYVAGYDASNNYLGDFTATWVSTGTIDVINYSGTNFTFQPVKAPASGTLIAQVGSVSDGTGTIIVTVGTLEHISINDSPGSGGVEITDMTLSSGQSVTLYLSGYDSDNNYISAIVSTWSSTGTLDSVTGSGPSYIFNPITAPSSGTIIATNGSLSDTTGLITIASGTLHHIVIRDSTSNGGNEVLDSTITTDGLLRLYAAGYDASNNYLGDQVVTWLSTGTLDIINFLGSNIIFEPTTSPTSGQIIAQRGTISDLTGVINVEDGLLNHIRITDSPDGLAVGDVDLIAGQPITLYSSGYDLDDNYISPTNAIWSSTGNLDSVSATGTAYIFTPLTAPTSGTIIATSGTLIDATGTITVEEGDISYILIRTAPSGGGTTLSDTTITADSMLTMYAASFDASDNYLGDLTVSWSSTGTLDPVLTTGTNFTFDPVTAPSLGTIIATSGTFIDETGNISVTVGAFSQIRINDAFGAGGVEVQAITITTDDPQPLYCAGYDDDGNYIDMFNAIWSSTGSLDSIDTTGTTFTFDPITAPTLGTIEAVYNTFFDETGTITVNHGAVDYILITDSPGGSEVGNLDLIVNQTFIFYSSSYDQDSNYVSPQSAAWSTTGSLNNEQYEGTTFPFTPTLAPTTGTIIANSGSMGDATGTINVNLGSLAYILIRTAPGGAGIEFGEYTMTTDDSITIWAATYDAGNNYLGDTTATWSRIGSLDPVSWVGMSYTFSPITAPTSGIIIANFEGHADETELINVNPGIAASLIDADNLSNERTTIAGSAQLLRIKVIDYHGNGVPGETVSFFPSIQMSNPTAISNEFGIVETFYTSPRDESSSIVESSVSGLDPLFFTVYGIRYNNFSLDPKVVNRGKNVAFSLNVSNPGNIDVPINTSASNISFSDNLGHNFSASLSSPSVLPANMTNVQLQFTNTLIDSNFQGGKYTPEIQIVGSANFSSMNGILLTDPAELTIGDSEITIGSVLIEQVLQGEEGIIATLTVINTGFPLSIDPYPQTRLEFRQQGTVYNPDYFERIDTLTVLQTGIPNILQFQFDIPNNYPIGEIEVYVRLSLDEGNLVVMPQDPSGTFQVLSGGNANYIPNSLDPAIVVPRQNVNFQAEFENTGTADIVLNPTETYFEILNSGISPINLLGQFSLIGENITEISFEGIEIPSNMNEGFYNVRWRLYGTMINGTVIYDTLITSNNALRVISNARLLFSNINIPDGVVRQGQSNVEIEYTIRNDGDSDARISALEHKFKSMSGDDIPASDWIATGTEPSLPDTIASGSSLTLTSFYTISQNAQTGFIRPAPIVHYRDLRTIFIIDTSQTILMNDSVQVIKPASIRIDDLSVLQDMLAPNAPYVNENQQFHLRVILNNTGPDLIDSVMVHLYKNSNQIPLDSVILEDIPTGTTTSHIFIRSESIAGRKTYKALISYATDGIGNPAQIEQPVDNTEDVFIQIPSQLTMNAVLFALGEELDSIVVSEEQIFNVRINIENNGQSPYGSGELVIRLPETHFTWLNRQNPDSIKIFTSDQSFVEWNIKADQPSDPGIYESITFAVLQAPIDSNTNEDVQYVIQDDSVSVRVEEKGAIDLNQLSIISPDGALDETISTDQNFTLHTEIIYNLTISQTDRIAKIILPSGFSAQGGDERVLPGDTTLITQDWIVKAPEVSSTMEDIFVHVSGYDKNSGLLIENNSTILQFNVVDKAMLNLSSRIVKLQGAENDTLSVGQQFMMEALIENNGTASTMGDGQVFIEDLDSNPYISRDYSQGSFSDTLSFNVDDPVSWNLYIEQLPADTISNLLQSLINMLDIKKQNARKLNYNLHDSYSSPREIFKQIFNLTGQLSIASTEISVRIKSTPNDENSNLPADTVAAAQIKTLFIENIASLELAEIIMPDTVSTGQIFSLKVKAIPSPNIYNSKAIVQLPTSFGGPANLIALFNQDSLATFNIEIPTSADGLASQETLWVIIQGEDENSGLPALVSLPAFKILNIQLRPKLAMNYEIKSPASAVIKNVLSHGQSILIEVWADTLHQLSDLTYANMKDTGSIVLDQRLFNNDNFQMIENEIYEKTFTRFKERLDFIVRAPLVDITTNINFNFNHLPKDKNSNDVLAVDVDSGKVNIPITVNEKEIIVSKIDSLVGNTDFTRGQEGNVLFAFEISNRGYLDSLFMNAIELIFRAHDDTSKLTELALLNMMESIQIINYDQYKLNLGKGTNGIPKIYADYHFDEQQPTNPLKINFNDQAIISSDSAVQVLVISKFKSNAATRSFRTVLSGVNAYDDNPNYMVAIVDEEGRPIQDNDYYESIIFNLLTDNPKEAFSNYPNPFGQPPNETTRISFLLKERSDVHLRIFTLLGELVRSKWDRNLSGLNEGLYSGYIRWDGRNDRGHKVLNGVYLCTIEIKGNGSTHRYITKIAYIK